MVSISHGFSFSVMFCHLVAGCNKKLFQLIAKLFYSKDAPKTIIIGEACRELLLFGTVYDSERKIKKVNLDVDNEAGLVTFFSFAYGPFYRSREQHCWKELKRHAWENVQRHTRKCLSTTMTEADAAVTRQYIEAMKKAAVDGGRSFYIQENHLDPDSLDGISTDEFIWMMVIDGCFFLQIALILLGSSDGVRSHLLEPDDGYFFGQPAVNRESILKAATSSMFVVGNQIPFVVLKTLMGQEFFKKAIHREIWEQPLDLERLALFKLLLVPEAMTKSPSNEERQYQTPMRIPTALFLDNQHVVCEIVDHLSVATKNLPNRSQASSSQTSTQESSSQVSRGKFWVIVKALCITSISACIKDKNPPIQVNDLLNGLRFLLVGHMRPYVRRRQRRSKGNIPNKSSVLLPAIPSATQLKEMSIIFQHSESTRVDKISLKKVMFNASLYLPRIVIDFDNNVETLLKNLIRYEVMHLEESSWTVCKYLTFMRELIRSPEDVAVLTSSGVIVADPYQESRVPILFRDLGIPRMKHYRLRKFRDRLINYTRPSPYKKVQDVLTIVLLLGLIQTVFSVLAYFQQKA